MTVESKAGIPVRGLGDWGLGQMTAALLSLHCLTAGHACQWTSGDDPLMLRGELDKGRKRRDEV